MLSGKFIMTKKTKAVLNDEGEEIEPEFDILTGATPSSDGGTENNNSSGSSNKHHLPRKEKDWKIAVKSRLNQE